MSIKKILEFMLCCFLCSSINIYAQSKYCEKGQEAAKKIISNNEIYFPREVVESSLTFRKLLEIDYKIKDELYDNGYDFEFEDESECFYKVMLNEIENRWGKDFIKIKQAEADKLDKGGIGYIKPNENGVIDSLMRYLKINALDRKPKMGYLIAFKISPEKKVVDVQVFFGLFHPKPIEKTSNDYIFVEKAFKSININCEPARFRDKPIESWLYFRISF